MKIVRQRDGARIASDVRPLKKIWLRLVGLMGTEKMGKEEGVWIEPCNSIHTFFMRFPIDAVFVDSKGKVLRVYRALQPWRATFPVFGARAVLELNAGCAGDTREGDYLLCSN